MTSQLRVRDLEAALAAERGALRDAASGLELLRTRFQEVERAYGAERERVGRTERALSRWASLVGVTQGCWIYVPAPVFVML